MSTFFGRLADRITSAGSRVNPVPATPFAAAQGLQQHYVDNVGESGALEPHGPQAEARNILYQARPAARSPLSNESSVSGREDSLLRNEQPAHSHPAETHPTIVRRQLPTLDGNRDEEKNPLEIKFPRASCGIPRILPAEPATRNQIPSQIEQVKNENELRRRSTNEKFLQPGIYVTIGRIEVRAAPSKREERPTDRRAPRKPQVSLEDYLQRRNEGRR
jgi:hypothetical protein